MSLYVGVNGSTKKVSKLLVGVNGSAKEVNTGYTGGGVNSGLNKVYEGFNKDTEFTKVNPVKLLTSGKITSDDIGRTVYLSNSRSKCQEWQVADVNHDGTSGTVDLFPKYLLGGSAIFGDTGEYPASPLRNTLNSTYYNGFTTEIQNAMKQQYVYWRYDSRGSGYVYDKLKIPTAMEVGVNSGSETTSYPDTTYPLFGTRSSHNKLAVRYFYKSSYSTSYWTRTTQLNDGNLCITINGEGGANERTSDSDINFLAIIRF